jgi:DNA-binding PadR family transcriptional regulator
MKSFEGKYEASWGSVYPALNAFLDEGLVAGRPDGLTGGAARYEILRRGRRLLAAKADVVARIESRTGIRLRQVASVDAALARFPAGVRSLGVSPVVLEAALGRTLRSLARSKEAR